MGEVGRRQEQPGFEAKVPSRRSLRRAAGTAPNGAAQPSQHLARWCSANFRRSGDVGFPVEFLSSGQYVQSLSSGCMAKRKRSRRGSGGGGGFALPPVKKQKANGKGRGVQQQIAAKKEVEQSNAIDVASASSQGGQGDVEEDGPAPELPVVSAKRKRRMETLLKAGKLVQSDLDLKTLTSTKSDKRLVS